MSLLEEVLLNRIRIAGLPEPEREVQLVPGRKWRVDFVWRAPHLLTVEVEGGVWMGKSGHNTGAGITRDIEKQNALVVLGYRPLRFTAQQINSGEAIRVLSAALASARAA